MSAPNPFVVVPICLSISGTSVNELIYQKRKVLDAIEELKSSLKLSWPHARDYQGLSFKLRDACTQAALRYSVLENLEAVVRQELEQIMDAFPKAAR